jgi:hypothetical protein
MQSIRCPTHADCALNKVVISGKLLQWSDTCDLHKSLKARGVEISRQFSRLLFLLSDLD